MLKIDITIFDY